MKNNAAFTKEEAEVIIANLTYEEKLLLRDFLLALRSDDEAAS